MLAARCPGCSYTYEVAAGDEHEGFAAGTAWADIPADWCCPDCGVRDKADFVPFDPSRAVARCRLGPLLADERGRRRPRLPRLGAMSTVAGPRCASGCVDGRRRR